MYDVTISEDDIKLIRWSLQVAGDALAVQEEGPISPEEALAFMAQLEALDATLVEQVKPQRDEVLGGSPDKRRVEQLSFGV
jgi:hypothetical protein